MINDLITAKEFETKVLKQEEILLFLRCSEGYLVKDYDYDRKVSDKVNISNFIKNRILDKIDKIDNIEIEIIGGHSFGYRKPLPQTTIGKLRKSYEK